MFAHRTATGLTVALLALPATATATPAPSSSQAYSDHYGWGTVSDPQSPAAPRTSSLAGTTSSQYFISPDAADAARAGDIAKAMEHYQRSQPAPAAAKPASHTGEPAVWPEIAFAGIILLVTAGGVVRVRVRHSRRVAA